MAENRDTNWQRRSGVKNNNKKKNNNNTIEQRNQI